MKTPSQRGQFGSWLHAERTRRYRRQADALADMQRLAGLSISESEFAQWESGSRVPREDNPKVQRLYEFFGSSPAQADRSADIPESVLERMVAVFEQQVVALNRANELAEMRLRAAEDQNAILTGLLFRETEDPRVHELVERLRRARDETLARPEAAATQSQHPRPDRRLSAEA